MHHGDGTQQIFQRENGLLFISLHRHDYGEFYPGTGTHEDIGMDAGKGYTLNLPWNLGKVLFESDLGDNEYLFACEELLFPIIREYEPELILVSCGFDSAKGDPKG